MRKTFAVLRRQPDGLKQLADPIAALATIAEAVNGERLADDAASRHARIERCEGILKDHLHSAAKAAHGIPTKPLKLNPSKLHAAGARRIEPRKHACKRGLAAAALTNHGDGLTACDGEVHAIDSVQSQTLTPQHALAGDREMLD